MMVRNIIEFFIVSLVVSVLLLVLSAPACADDFSLRLAVNGNDIAGLDAVEIDPDGELIIEIRISDNPREITLHKLTLTVTFIDMAVFTVDEPLHDHYMAPYDFYHNEIPLDARDFLKLGDMTLATGKYRTKVSLDYSVGGSRAVLNRWVDVRVTGNPVLTPVGGAGAAVTAFTVGAIVWLAKGLSGLYHYAMGNLESLARGRVVGSLVNAARKRIVKDKCPICGSRFESGYCPVCKKPAKQIRREYRDRLQKLAQQGDELLADGETTWDDLPGKLGISGQLASDVLAVIRNARKFRVQGMARNLILRAVFAGIGFAISTVIWVTVGGFAVLNTAALVAILIAAIVIPLVITLIFRIRAKRAIARSMS